MMVRKKWQCHPNLNCFQWPCRSQLNHFEQLNILNIFFSQSIHGSVCIKIYSCLYILGKGSPARGWSLGVLAIKCSKTSSLKYSLKCCVVWNVLTFQMSHVFSHHWKNWSGHLSLWNTPPRTALQSHVPSSVHLQ